MARSCEKALTFTARVHTGTFNSSDVSTVVELCRRSRKLFLCLCRLPCAFSPTRKVFNDANLDQAVNGAMAAKFRFAGQACIAPNRFMVQEGIHEEFVAKMAERMRDIRVGHGLDPRTTMGPLINLAAKDKVNRKYSTKRAGVPPCV